ncbi:hypothetical protein HY029_05580 [Candidatus Gottesmanbacteria bacterium]|nr:hypothetical protein [Candidatus Gottesmanbacteria bacterium]
MLLAQTLNIPGSTTSIVGPLDPKFTDIASVVNAAQAFIFPIAGVMLLAYLVWGGFSYITAMGDPKKAEGARARLTHAVIGFLIIFAAYWIVQIVNQIFGLQSV